MELVVGEVIGEMQELDGVDFRIVKVDYLFFFLLVNTTRVRSRTWSINSWIVGYARVSTVARRSIIHLIPKVS